MDLEYHPIELGPQKSSQKEKKHKRSAYAESIRLIARRDYSRIKLKKKLLEKKYDQEEIEDCLERLEQEGYLREQAYIEARIRAFMHKGWSPKHIQLKLKQEELNVKSETIDSIFSENNFSTQIQIEHLIQKKIPATLPDKEDYESWAKIKRRALNFLASKGHNPSECYDALSRVINQLKNS